MAKILSLYTANLSMLVTSQLDTERLSVCMCTGVGEHRKVVRKVKGYSRKDKKSKTTAFYLKDSNLI